MQQRNNQLFQAIFDRNLNQIRRLLQQGADPDAVDQGTSFHPLHYVVSDPHPQTLEIMDLLVGHGADVDAITRNGYTPIRLALEIGTEPIVRRLLDMGAEWQKVKQHVGAKSSKSLKQHQTAYSIHKKRHVEKRPPIQNQVAAGGGGRSPSSQQTFYPRQATDLLFQGVQQMDIKKIRHAIKNGAQLNSRRKGETPMTVLLQRHPEKDQEDLIKIMTFMIQNQADVNFKDSSDHTPLWYAQADNRKKIVDFLKKKQHPQQQKTPQKQRDRQVFEFATKGASFDIARFLKDLYK